MNNIAHLICSKNFSGIEQHVHELTSTLTNNSDYDLYIFADKTLKPHFQNQRFQIFPNKFRFNLFALFKLRKLIKDHKIQHMDYTIFLIGIRIKICFVFPLFTEMGNRHF